MSTADSMRFEVFTEVAAGSQVWGSRTAPYRQGEITGDRVRTTFDMSASAAALVIVMGGLDPLSAKATLIVDGDTTFITTPFLFDLFTLGGAPLEPQFEWVRQLENDWGYIDRSNFDSELEVLEMAGLYGGGSASQLISLLDVTCAVTDGGASEVRGVPIRIAKAEVAASDLLALIQLEMESFGAGAPLSLIDPTERVVATTITVGAGPITPVVAHDLIWVPNSSDASVSVVDPVERSVVDTIAVGAVPLTPLAADGLIWVPNRGDGTVSVIDPAVRTVVSTISVGAEPQTPVAANSLIWVPNRGDGTVSVIDPIARTVESTIAVGTSPETAIVANNLIWVPNRGDGTVSVIEPIARTVESTIAVGTSPLAATYAFGQVWVPNQSDGTVSVIDPFERVVVTTLDVGRSPLTPAATNNMIWVPNLGDATVSVFGPGQPG